MTTTAVRRPPSDLPAFWSHRSRGLVAAVWWLWQLSWLTDNSKSCRCCCCCCCGCISKWLLIIALKFMLMSSNSLPLAPALSKRLTVCSALGISIIEVSVVTPRMQPSLDASATCYKWLIHRAHCLSMAADPEQLTCPTRCHCLFLVAATFVYTSIHFIILSIHSLQSFLRQWLTEIISKDKHCLGLLPESGSECPDDFWINILQIYCHLFGNILKCIFEILFWILKTYLLPCIKYLIWK